MQVYYINLARRKDRRVEVEQRFHALGLGCERVEATTPDEISADQRNRYCNPRAYRWQSEGELACSLSHVEAMRRLIASRAPYAAIFEDDAVLSPSLPSFLEAFEQTAPLVDLLRLETDHNRMRLVPEPDLAIAGFGLHRIYSTGAGAAGYIVSRRAAERIISGEEVLFNLTDEALFNPYEKLAGELVMRQLNPALVVQANRLADKGNRAEGSDLEPLRLRRLSASGSHRWSRLHHDVLEFIDRDIRVAALKAWHRHVGGAEKVAIPLKPD